MCLVPFDNKTKTLSHCSSSGASKLSAWARINMKQFGNEDQNAVDSLDQVECEHENACRRSGVHCKYASSKQVTLQGPRSKLFYESYE